MTTTPHWFAVSQADPRAVGLYRRHYSAQLGSRQKGIAGPGQTLTLLTPDGLALWLWRLTRWTQGAHLAPFAGGVNCAVFRNEGPTRSSELVGEATALAVSRWPGCPLYTWVDPAAIRSSNPGYCFIAAGWQRTGDVSARGLVLLAFTN